MVVCIDGLKDDKSIANDRCLSDLTDNIEICEYFRVEQESD